MLSRRRSDVEHQFRARCMQVTRSQFRPRFNQPNPHFSTARANLRSFNKIIPTRFQNSSSCPLPIRNIHPIITNSTPPGILSPINRPDSISNPFFPSIHIFLLPLPIPSSTRSIAIFDFNGIDTLTNDSFRWMYTIWFESNTECVPEVAGWKINVTSFGLNKRGRIDLTLYLQFILF